MNKSESIKELSTALAKAQALIPEVKRTKQAYNYSYAPLDSVMEAIKKPLKDNGLSISQAPYNDADSFGVEAMLLHESGEWLLSRFGTKLIKNDPQSVGSVITYYRRYGLSAMLGVCTDEDDDAQNVSANKSVRRDNIKQVATPENTKLEDYTIGFGKFNGKKLTEVPYDELEGYVSYLLKASKEANKSLDRFTQVFVEKFFELKESYSK